MNHVMIDIETAGLSPSNQILSIGAIIFNPMTGELMGEREWFPEMGNGSINHQTFLWWLGQSEKARSSVINKERQGLRIIGGELQSFIQSAGDKVPIWAMGPQFDLSALEYHLSGYVEGSLWHYRQPHDARTLRLLHEDTSMVMEEGDEHTCLGDCRRQIRFVVSALRALGYRGEPS